MKKAIVVIALSLASVGIVDAADSLSSNTLTTFDPRGLTFDVSCEILLNTKIPLGTMIIIK